MEELSLVEKSPDTFFVFNFSPDFRAGNNNPPCEGAFLGRYVPKDVRNTDDPAKIPFFQKEGTEMWYEEGSNHRVQDGRIVRDMPVENCWFVKLGSLEDLNEIVLSNGGIATLTSCDVEHNSIILGDLFSDGDFSDAIISNESL